MITSMLNSYGFHFVAESMVMFLLFFTTMKLLIQVDIPKMLDKIKVRDSKKKEQQRLQQLRVEAAIQNLLNSVCRTNLTKKRVCDHCSVSLFHDGTKTIDGRFDWEFAEIFKEASYNDYYSSEIIGIQSTQLYPHYTYLKEHKSFRGNIEAMEEIDSRLARIERKNKVKYLWIDMIFDKDGKPYGNIAFSWEEVPENIDTARLTEVSTDIQNYITKNEEMIL